jgi:hypothetical protein
VYRFSFVSDFEQLGYLITSSGEAVPEQSSDAGIYRLEKVLSYLDMIASGIDLYANLYQPLGLTEDVYKLDIPRIATSMVYKLVKQSDTSIVLYVPQPFIRDMNPSVRQYEKSMLVIDVGIYGKEYEEAVVELNDNNIDKYAGKMYSICSTSTGEFDNRVIHSTDVGKFIKVNYYEELLTPIFEKQFGMKPEEGKKLAVLTTYDKVWLTDDEKKVMDDALVINKSTSTVSLINLFDLEKTNAIFIENRRLKGRIKALEEILQRQQNQ